MAYSLWDSTDDILSMYIAVTGIGVAGANLGENVRKVRNPLVHPIGWVTNAMILLIIPNLYIVYFRGTFNAY